MTDILKIVSVILPYSLIIFFIFLTYIASPVPQVSTSKQSDHKKISVNKAFLSSDGLIRADLKTAESEENEFEFIMEHCGCKRKLKGVQRNPPNLTVNQTTCSSDAFHRGPHQKILAYSFYRNGDAPKLSSSELK